MEAKVEVGTNWPITVDPHKCPVRPIKCPGGHGPVLTPNPHEWSYINRTNVTVP